MLGVNRPLATEFSFLVGIPTMLAAGGWKILEAVRHPSGGPPENWGMLALGTIVSAVVSFIAVKWLLRFVQTHTFTSFGWYRIALATAVFATANLGHRKPDVPVSSRAEHGQPSIPRSGAFRDHEGGGDASSPKAGRSALAAPSGDEASPPLPGASVASDLLLIGWTGIESPSLFRCRDQKLGADLHAFRFQSGIRFENLVHRHFVSLVRVGLRDGGNGIAGSDGVFKRFVRTG